VYVQHEGPITLYVKVGHTILQVKDVLPSGVILLEGKDGQECRCPMSFANSRINLPSTCNGANYLQMCDLWTKERCNNHIIVWPLSTRLAHGMFIIAIDDTSKRRMGLLALLPENHMISGK
jgi:hypothetical protein